MALGFLFPSSSSGRDLTDDIPEKVDAFNSFFILSLPLINPLRSLKDFYLPLRFHCNRLELQLLISDLPSMHSPNQTISRNIQFPSSNRFRWQIHTLSLPIWEPADGERQRISKLIPLLAYHMKNEEFNYMTRHTNKALLKWGQSLQATRWSEKQALWIGDAHDMWGVKWEDEWWLKKWCAKVPVNLKIDIIAKVDATYLLGYNIATSRLLYGRIWGFQVLEMLKPIMYYNPCSNISSQVVSSSP